MCDDVARFQNFAHGVFLLGSAPIMALPSLDPCCVILWTSMLCLILLTYGVNCENMHVFAYKATVWTVCGSVGRRRRRREMPLVTEHYHPICFYKCAHGLVYKCSIAVHLLSTKHLLLSHNYQCWQSWILIIFTTHVLIHSPTFAGIQCQFRRSSPEMQSIMLLVWKQCHWPTTIKLPIHIFD